MACRMTVLLVDDEPGLADLAASFLERHLHGIETRTATTVDAALSAVRSADAIDCVVSDYDLGERTGLDLLDGVRSAGVEVPFVLFTGKGSEEIASDALRAGVTDYLRKEAGTEQYRVLANRVERAVAARRAERAARRNEALLRGAVDALDDVFYLFDRDGSFVLWNDALSDATGYGDAEIESMSPTDFFDGEAKDRVAEAIETAFDRGRVTIETELSTKGGRRIPYEFTGARLTDGDGAEIGVCGVGRDISRRTTLERELDALLNRVTDAFLGLDADWRYTYLNRRAEELLGRTGDDLLGRRVWDAFPELRDSRIGAAMRRAVETGDQLTVEGYYEPLETGFACHLYPSETGLSVYFREVSSANGGDG
ncbi:PAS domain-containing response regulator [Halegenticoccus soli]|uniref:PAS domain-containing response regulator n=1 Tax=Halegenticoccus soli TaxID=1985678 RepID=UPI0013041122|nr:PAS domain-containing protein [Halegenticoccus soli]